MPKQTSTVTEKYQLPGDGDGKLQEKPIPHSFVFPLKLSNQSASGNKNEEAAVTSALKTKHTKGLPTCLRENQNITSRNVLKHTEDVPLQQVRHLSIYAQYFMF